MMGLCMPQVPLGIMFLFYFISFLLIYYKVFISSTLISQILRLSVTWHILRQNFTDSAFNFEAKLRPTLKNMNECTNPQAPNTTIPHILPFILLLERSQEDTRSKYDLNLFTSESLFNFINCVLAGNIV